MTEQEKLAVRLEHWIEHNASHTTEFQQGAEKAKGLGHEDVGDEMLAAVEKLEQASKHLRNAAEKLRQ